MGRVAERGKGNKTPSMTFGKLLEKYRDEVSVKKKSERWEQIRIAKFQHEPIAQVELHNLSKSIFSDWRDRRLKEVSNLSALREWTLLNYALEITKKCVGVA